MQKIALIYLLSLLSIYVASGQTIEYREYIKEVCDYNNAIKSSKNSTTAALYSLEVVKRNRYPRLDASLNGTYALREYALLPSYVLERSAGALGVTLSQNIYSGGGVKSSVALSQNSVDMSQYNYLLTRENVIVAASNTYWMVVAAKAYVEVAQKYLDIIESNYELLQIKFNDGLIAKNDLLMMLTRKKQAEYGLSQAVKSYERLISDFNILRGEVANKPLLLSAQIVVESVETPLFIDPASCIENRYEYKISKSTLSQSELNARANRAKFLPQISVGVSGSYGTKALNFDNSLIVDGAIFLKLSAPLFAWGQRRQQRLSDLARIRSSENSVASQVDEISSQIYESFIALSESFEQLELTATSLEIAEESLELAILSFDEGMISVLELLTSQLSWLSAYNNKISANMSYRISLINYQRATATMEHE